MKHYLSLTTKHTLIVCVTHTVSSLFVIHFHISGIIIKAKNLDIFAVNVLVMRYFTFISHAEAIVYNEQKLVLFRLVSNFNLQNLLIIPVCYMLNLFVLKYQRN